MQKSAAWLGDRLKTAGGRSVLYRRGNHVAELTATPQQYAATVVQDGQDIEIDAYAWTVTATDLLLNGEQVEPQEGDVIEERLNGKTVKWHVMPLGDNEQSWKWLDSSGVLLLIHTKRVQ